VLAARICPRLASVLWSEPAGPRRWLDHRPSACLRGVIEGMRAKKVFSPDLSIPDGAFAKSIELMQKAGLADDRLVANARNVLDDSYRLAALKAA